MNFHELAVAGAYLIDIEPSADERGFFARAWCSREFAARGLAAEMVQASLVHSPRRGTLRGLHYQAAPHEEAKLVRCIRGSAYVVVLDLRIGSPTYLHWAGVELSCNNRQSLYVPPGCAQGYQTLEDDCEMLYQMSTAYVPSAGRGVRYNDPEFNIEWPLEVSIISKADQTRANFAPTGFGRQDSSASDPARAVPVSNS